MNSTFDDLLINGVATQAAAASLPNHLVRLAEVQALLAAQAATPGAPGAPGASVYPYVAYASDNLGTGFSLTPGSGLTYVAWLFSPTVIATPAAANFAGRWEQFVGAPGAAGTPGTPGAAGQSAYLYVGYASDSSGTGFSLTPSDSLQYIAVLNSTTPIPAPAAGNFAGLWKKYGAAILSVDGASALTLTSGVLSLNASSASTASYLVQRDASGNFAGNCVTATTLSIAGSATISFAAGTVTINQPLTVTALNVGTLSGVLKATAGVVAVATSNDLAEGSVNLTTPAGNAYFTQARVRATPLTGYTTAAGTPLLLTSDTLLAALGKLDAALGGSFSGYVSGAGTITTGDTVLSAIQKLNGNVAALSGTPGALAVTQPVTTAGSPNILTVTGAANTTLAGGTEASDVIFNCARTVQFNTGALALQRAVRIEAPTYAFVAASTLAIAATAGIAGCPVAGANATVTLAAALKIYGGAAGSGTASAYGLYVDCPTGAANNYAAAFNTGDVLVNAGWLRAATGYGLKVNAVQVVTNRQTGWTAATGTATRATFATASVTLPALAQAVKALIDDLTTHGLIGA